MDLKRHKINILGVDVDDISEKEAISYILKLATDKKSHHYVVTVNAEFVMLGRKNPKFAEILNNSDLAIADGWPVAKSRLIFGGKAQERVAGVDLVEKLCSESARKAVRVGFLGGFSSVAKAVSKRQKAKNTGLKVVFAGPGDPAIGQDLRLKRQISASGRIDILFVAYGMGRQEFWVQRNKNSLDVGVFIGVGGAFDYLAFVKKRAPKWMQDSGMEWLWRLGSEPSRIWRMRVLPVFLALVVKSWLSRIIFSKN